MVMDTYIFFCVIKMFSKSQNNTEIFMLSIKHDYKYTLP